MSQLPVLRHQPVCRTRRCTTGGSASRLDRTSIPGRSVRARLSQLSVVQLKHLDNSLQYFIFHMRALSIAFLLYLLYLLHLCIFMQRTFVPINLNHFAAIIYNRQPHPPPPYRFRSLQSLCGTPSLAFSMKEQRKTISEIYTKKRFKKILKLVIKLRRSMCLGARTPFSRLFVRWVGRFSG